MTNHWRAVSASERKREYQINYRDLDPACPVFRMRVKAYDREHAEEVFWDCGDPSDDGWVILSITAVR